MGALTCLTQAGDVFFLKSGRCLFFSLVAFRTPHEIAESPSAPQPSTIPEIHHDFLVRFAWVGREENIGADGRSGGVVQRSRRQIEICDLRWKLRLPHCAPLSSKPYSKPTRRERPKEVPASNSFARVYPSRPALHFENAACWSKEPETVSLSAIRASKGPLFHRVFNRLD